MFPEKKAVFGCDKTIGVLVSSRVYVRLRAAGLCAVLMLWRRTPLLCSHLIYMQ